MLLKNFVFWYSLSSFDDTNHIFYALDKNVKFLSKLPLFFAYSVSKHIYGLVLTFVCLMRVWVDDRYWPWMFGVLKWTDLYSHLGGLFLFFPSRVDLFPSCGYLGSSPFCLLIRLAVTLTWPGDPFGSIETARKVIEPLYRQMKKNQL